MPLLSIARFFAALLSFAILAAAGYLLWTWYDGEWIRDASGALVRVRDEWRLVAGGLLLAWSFLGRLATPLLLAKRDERGTSLDRGAGRTIPGANGEPLYIETVGRSGAPVLLFTHGWSMDSTFWRYAKEDLGGRFRLVLWDLPGLGRSRRRAGPIDLDAFAEDLAKVMETAGSGRPVLVGHSIGGMTIQTLLKNRPELHSRIAGVVLLNTTYTNPVRTMVLSRLLLALQRPVLEPITKLLILLHPLVWVSKW